MEGANGVGHRRPMSHGPCEGTFHARSSQTAGPRGGLLPCCARSGRGRRSVGDRRVPREVNGSELGYGLRVVQKIRGAERNPLPGEVCLMEAKQGYVEETELPLETIRTGLG
jgi:hypothetical protein